LRKTHIYNIICIDIGIFEVCLEVKLPTLWTDEKAEVGRVREEKKQRWEESERRRAEERRSEKRKSEKKKIQVREKIGKSRITVFFQ